MAQFDPRYHDHQRRRWMRPNAHLYMRPDAERWLRPDAARFMRLEAQRDSKSGECDTGARRSDREGWTNRTSLPIRPQFVCDDAADALRSLRWELAKLRLKWAFERFERFERAQRKAYNPDQPRVPAGNPDGGQWTSGGAGKVRLAAGDKPTLGRGAVAALALQAAKKLIESYRSQNLLRDMFGENEGTVAVTTVNGADIYGSNSRSPTYTAVDRAAAVDIRDTLIAKYPDLMRADNLGAAPNNALFHAEATVLIRAARANGGTLEGRVLEVFADRPMCRNCEAVLPLLVRELGNPRITFAGPGGQIRVIRNGRWVE